MEITQITKEAAIKENLVKYLLILSQINDLPKKLNEPKKPMVVDSFQELEAYQDELSRVKTSNEQRNKNYQRLIKDKQQLDSYFIRELPQYIWLKLQINSDFVESGIYHIGIGSNNWGGHSTTVHVLNPGDEVQELKHVVYN